MKAVFAATREQAERIAKEHARSYGGVWKGYGRFAIPCGYCFDEIVFVNIYCGQSIRDSRGTQEWMNSVVLTRLQPGGVARHA